jgi:hypothetical protein
MYPPCINPARLAVHGKVAHDYALALGVLARLVRDEFPPELTLREIADVWSNATPEELDALRVAEILLGS